jgi:membrane-bound lytic murein transglycosylase D
MLKRSLIFLSLLALAFSAGILFIYWIPASEEDSYYKESFRSHYGIYALPIPDSLSFAGEPVPMEAWDLRERFDREILVNTYWQSNTLLYFKRANRWFPVIEPILASQGVPDDFKYLALIESGLMNAVSPAGAAGYWQLLERTGRELGLEVNAQVDERYHVEKATAAACKYLLDAKARFGSWTLAAAAYNMGNAGISRQLESQKVTDYYDLHLNEETSRYLFRILAIKMIFSDPKASGFHFRESDLYPPLKYTVVTVDSTITDLPAFALQQGTNYKTLRLLNPWIRSTELPNRSNKQYEIKMPV